MVTGILWAVFGVFCLLLLLSLHATWRFRRYVTRCLGADRPDFAPPLTVVMPCKGLDPGFDANISSMLAQDYPDYEVLFVTATQSDPAYERVRALCRGTQE